MNLKVETKNEENLELKSKWTNNSEKVKVTEEELAMINSKNLELRSKLEDICESC